MDFCLPLHIQDNSGAWHSPRKDVRSEVRCYNMNLPHFQIQNQFVIE
jgi:hypothetical protein